MREAIEWLGNLRITNLDDYGVRSDSIEVLAAFIMMIGGIFITHRIQVWADRAGEHPRAANTGLGGGAERMEQKTYRE
ncbi:MAG TPA: hypothetical protein VFL82_00595 [Thermomicrobiales bacterium]|nr:hypothetical protein [Thermomicrobiales bacterium]